ncbi:AmmeMemoRadiSam system protein B|nr:AmmeMemoRadiSam system protein B [archaeon]
MALFSREMVAAGSFYPANPEELREVIDDFYTAKRPYKKREGFLQGMIVPHAGYVYSGRTAAKAFYELSKHEARTFVVLGPNHTGMGEDLSVMYNAAYKTPLGRVKIDAELGRSVCKEMKVQNDFLAHSREHSIEVQLPFLQYLFSDEVRVLPIIIGDVEIDELKKLGKLLADKDVTIIASSDFTHHGSAYGYSPFQNVKLELREHDMKAIELIQKLKVKEFHELGRGSTICGYKPITCLLQAMKSRGAEAKFLEYSISADVTKDYENVVAYASLVFR